MAEDQQGGGKATGLKGMSLLWRILLSTSIAFAVLFAITGWTVQTYARRVSERSLEEEVRTSLEAYQALWAARTHALASISRLISSMSDVRGAFRTEDRATIRDTAGQLWSQISEQDDNAVFLVLDPTGNVVASLGGEYPDLTISGPELKSAMRAFPKQVKGYLTRGTHLYYVVLTPVYVQGGHGEALLNILLVAFDIKDELARDLKVSTHGSDFAFACSRRVVASTIPSLSIQDLRSGRDLQGGVRRLMLRGKDYLLLSVDLLNIDQKPAGQLYIVRSFLEPQRALGELQRNVALIWLLVIALGLLLTYWLARRILRPIRRLDQAAGEVIKGHYEWRVPVETNDELGRLGQTFNMMCSSIRSAREKLIQQERISTIGRLASSIVHDLRNPLASIYGGAEMLMDAELSPEQSKRLALNIYKASERIRRLLQDLTEVGRRRSREAEICSVADLVRAAVETVAREAESQQVAIRIQVPEGIEVSVERDRLERVFFNLITNALEAMSNGGEIEISAQAGKQFALIGVKDSGPGISPEVRSTLFQPFASYGKRNGIGLGLALARQTVLEHGGELWADEHTGSGALFLLRLPLVKHVGTLAESAWSARRG